MGTPERFLFDVSFDQPDLSHDPTHGVAPEPRFSTADIDAARAEGYATGRTEALAEAAQMIETQVAHAAQNLTGAIERLLAEGARMESATERAAIALIRTVLHKAVPTLAAKEPLEELEAFIARTLGEAFDEPRIVLRVNDALFEPVKARLPALSQAAGYSGKLVLLADPALQVGEGRIEWADGGAERDLGQLLGELDKILARPVLPDPTPSSTEPEEIPHG